jgi:virginiamycin B lyase
MKTITILVSAVGRTILCFGFLLLVAPAAEAGSIAITESETGLQSTDQVVTLTDGSVSVLRRGVPNPLLGPPIPGTVGRYSPGLGVTTVALPQELILRSIARGPDGNLWFGAYPGTIGRVGIDLSVKLFSIQDDAANALTAGPDSAIWYCAIDAIGSLTAEETTRRFPLPSFPSDPEGITAGSDGALWFTETASGKIGRITTAGAITEYPLPNAAASPSGISAGLDGALWFTEFVGNKIGRISTSGQIQEFPIPISGSGPMGITSGPDGAIWFTLVQAHAIGRISFDGEITTYDLSSGSRPESIATSPAGTLWVAEGNSKIAEIQIPQSSPALWLQGGRFQLSVSWSADNIGTSGMGQPVTLTNDSGYFWFFSPSNIEITVKVVDGRPVNDHFWVFIGGMTNVHFSLVVQDTVTGKSKTYTNPQGQFLSLGDTSAF